PRTRPVTVSSVTRPPGLRRTFASPGLRPSIASGGMRESMQVTTPTPAWAMPSKPPYSKSSAYSAFAASRSAKSSVRRAGRPGVVASGIMTRLWRLGDAGRSENGHVVRLLSARFRPGRGGRRRDDPPRPHPSVVVPARPPVPVPGHRRAGDAEHVEPILVDRLADRDLGDLTGLG